MAVLTGDLQTENDAQRLAKFGFPVKQIVTGGTCHLDARMVEKHLAAWKLEDIDLLIMENVGNLVCPSSYDLGEDAKIVLLSTTEGEDKPLKYPSIFFKSELMVLTKIDLLPYVPFSARVGERECAAGASPDGDTGSVEHHRRRARPLDGVAASAAKEGEVQSELDLLRQLEGQHHLAIGCGFGGAFILAPINACC